MTARAGSILLVAIVGCARASPVHTTPTNAACPAPQLDVRDWQTVADSAGVNYRLPRDFVKQPRTTAAQSWHRQGDFQQSITAGFIASSSPTATLGRVPHAGMKELTVCVDSIGGREILIQAWRTVDGTFRRFRRQDRYDVFAVVGVNRELHFYITSGSYLPETQEAALAVVRTIAIEDPPPPPPAGTPPD